MGWEGEDRAFASAFLALLCEGAASPVIEAWSVRLGRLNQLPHVLLGVKGFVE